MVYSNFFSLSRTVFELFVVFPYNRISYLGSDTTSPATSGRHLSKFEKLPKMPPPMALCQILLTRRFACHTNASCWMFRYWTQKSEETQCFSLDSGPDASRLCPNMRVFGPARGQEIGDSFNRFSFGLLWVRPTHRRCTPPVFAAITYISLSFKADLFRPTTKLHSRPILLLCLSVCLSCLMYVCSVVYCCQTVQDRICDVSVE